MASVSFRDIPSRCPNALTRESHTIGCAKDRLVARSANSPKGNAHQLGHPHHSEIPAAVAKASAANSFQASGSQRLAGKSTAPLPKAFDQLLEFLCLAGKDVMATASRVDRRLERLPSRSWALDLTSPSSRDDPCHKCSCVSASRRRGHSGRECG